MWDATIFSLDSTRVYINLDATTIFREQELEIGTISPRMM
jgi:hypothetical protein